MESTKVQTLGELRMRGAFKMHRASGPLSPRPGPLALCILKAQEVRNNEGCLSTPACYLLL